jgi:hypothetical protein
MGSELQSDRIEPDMFLVQESYVGNISSIVYKNRAYIALTYGLNQTANNRIYVFDFAKSDLGRKNPAWVPYVTLNAAQFTIYNSRLYYGSSLADGFVHQLDTTTYADNGAAIDSYIWTKEFSGNPGDENLEKDFRKAFLLVEKTGAYYMNVTVRLDSDLGDGTSQQVDLTPGGAVWNLFNWNEAVWGGGAQQSEVPIFLGQCRGKRIQFKFDNQAVAGQRFKVNGLKFTYNIRGIR